MKVYKNYSLKKYNTFGIDATAAAFADIESTEALKTVLKDNKLPIYLLGGGSNVLLTKDFYDCLFIKNSIAGIKIVDNAQNTEGSHTENFDKIQNMSKAESRIIIEIGGGETWHDVVIWAIENDLGGIENLSLIPGTIGAAPIQNIGAYGVELKNVFHKLEAFNLQTFDSQIFTLEDCQFGYRDSIFKNALKGHYLITKVFLTLTPTAFHTLNSQYGDIQKMLTINGLTEPTIKDISNAVIAIRQSKLPDPSVIGNAGSFFKNPEISLAQFNTLKAQFPLIVGYPTAKETVKVAAGWLIETAGWKGKRFGAIGVHERQALVLVNYGGGKGLEIKALAEKIQASIFDMFGIALMAEVNWL
jgi:UDP-N-acetylmuramate dehydrogenase